MPENSQPILQINSPTPAHAKCKLSAFLAPSRFYNSQALHLVDDSGNIINAKLRSLALWPDKSIKWLLVEAHLINAMSKNTTLSLQVIPNHHADKRHDWVNRTDKSLIINTAHTRFEFDLTHLCALSLFDNDSVKISQLSNAVAFAEQEYVFDAIETEYEVVYDTQENPLICHVKQLASIKLKSPKGKQTLVKLHADFSIFYHDASVRLNLRLHNTNAIVPEGGKWDLGNESSVYLASLGVCFDYNSDKQYINLDPNQSPKETQQAFDHIELIQHSSGGENWDSPNHKDRHNKLGVSKRGGVITLTTANENIQTTEILRPSPSITTQIKSTTLTISPDYFWQKFPSSVSACNTSTVIDYASLKTDCEVELQAGEIKSHSLWFSSSKGIDEAALAYTPNIKLVDSKSLVDDDIAHFHPLPFCGGDLTKHPLLNVDSEEKQTADVENWLAKRETLDEYGWRNFGDLYADHEAANYKGDDIFVSHYNNQYDPLLGFLKKWLLCGNPKYKQLADELFEHIANIDIYHTQGDKPDYNQGMFWHTDHYVKAETASHRTYSKHQEANVYMDHISGGGPGPHHCYSTGLAFYYLLTGNIAAKDITLGLFKWMQHIFEGDGTLLGLVLRIKNANHLRIPFTNKLLLGFGTGVLRNVFTNQYPLDRGTGNYLNLMLDCFMLTNQVDYLHKSEYVILNTINELDDIAKRNFDDIETTWFYTVFLQAVARYLSVVSEQALDGTNANSVCNEKAQIKRVVSIKNAFVHYAKWMADNETHYLANKDKLEYPNDTWTAQDLRKLHLLWCGYELTQDKKMLDKAKYLSDEIMPTLRQSDELLYTRLQALIMQNVVSPESIKSQFSGLDLIMNKAESLTIDSKVKHMPLNPSFLTRFFRFVKQYSFKRELALLVIRVQAVKRVFK